MPAHVSNLTDLGKALNPPVTRRAIDQWKRDDPDGAPKAKPDGRYVVAEWQAYMERMNRKRADESVPSEGSTYPTVKVSKEKEAAFKARKLELEVLQKEGKLLDRSEVEKRLGSMLTSFRKALDGIAPRVAKIISGKMDYERKVEIVQHEIDNAMRVMEAAETIT